MSEAPNISLLNPGSHSSKKNIKAFCRFCGAVSPSSMNEPPDSFEEGTVTPVWMVSLILGLCVTLLQVRESDAVSSEEKLRAIKSILRDFWGRDFESNYPRYMLGPSPAVVLIPRHEMIRIAAARLDGRRRDGSTTQGLTIGEKPNVKIVVVYDDVAPLLAANAIIHEIGHLERRDSGLSGNVEEAQVRKIVDAGFYEKLFGPHWIETTVKALETKVLPVEQNGHHYKGYTPEAVDTFYEQIKKAGAMLERNPLHDRIVANLVFVFTNTEQDLAAALDADDAVN